MASRADIVHRADGYIEKGNRYNWRWDWLDRDFDLTELVKTNRIRSHPQNGKVRYGEWIRKIRESGKAYCRLCQSEIVYASRGFDAITRHCSTSNHVRKIDSDPAQSTIPGRTTTSLQSSISSCDILFSVRF